ncbi:MAG: RNA polymerase sigma factor [Acidobacteriota bacterium]
MTAHSLSFADDLNVVMISDSKDIDTTQISFEELYRQHYRRVYSLCLRMTANVADAEDLAHDVFLQVQRKLASFRGESAFTTWLHRITVNQVLMHFRKKSVRSEMTTDDGEMPEAVEPFTERAQAAPVIDHIALATAIEKLPTGYRTVFLLHDVEGYEHEEIARVLNISAGTSKSQLHKARMRLRAMLHKRVENSNVETVAEALEQA